ncbi:hypothetical protein EV121DRAFT_274646 [Schizophyllum commune]
MSNLHTTSPGPASLYSRSIPPLSYFSHDQFLAIFACPILDTACPRRIRRRIHTERLVYPTASRHDPTDILASRDSALEPSPSPRSSTVSGYVAERGSAVGTASPRLVYSRALISPRRVPSPRDLGPDAHAHSEISVAAGSSTSAVVVGEQLCRTLSASGNAGHPDTSRDFPDEQTIPRPTPTNAALCFALLAGLLAGIRRPRLPATTSTTRIRADNDARAPLCGASHAGDGNYQEMYASTTTTTTTYCAAGSMRGSLESCFPTSAPPLLRQHSGMHSRAMSPSRHPSPSGIATTLDDVPPTEPAHWHKVAGSISSAWARREEEQTRQDLKVSPLLPLCRMRYLRIPVRRVLDVLNLSFSASWVFTKDTLETSPSERQHVRRRGKFLGYSCPSQGAREVGMDEETTRPLIQNAATLCVLRNVPAHMRRPPTPPVLECNPIPTLFAQGPVLDASDVQGRATGSAKRCPSFDSPSDFSCCFRASTRRRDSPTSPRVFLKRGGSVDSVPDVYDVLRVSSVGAPCSATRWHRIRASRARERPPSASPWLSQRSESKIAPSRAIPPCFELQIAVQTSISVFMLTSSDELGRFSKFFVVDPLVDACNR